MEWKDIAIEWKDITSDELERLMEVNTYVHLGGLFGISDTAVKKKCKKFGIWKRRAKYTGHNKKFKNVSKATGELKTCMWCGDIRGPYSKKYCSNKCQCEYIYHTYINEWLLGLHNEGSGECVSKHIRRFLFEKYDNSCSLCGWGELNPKSGKTPLEVEHIDGNSTNNEPKNLTLLCPNCHSLTPTYMALNMGNGRSLRRQRYQTGILQSNAGSDQGDHLPL